MDILISPVIAALVPVVMAATSLLKTFTGNFYAPLLALMLGIGGSFLQPQTTWQATVIVGIVIGTTAAGFYSGGKTLVS